MATKDMKLKDLPRKTDAEKKIYNDLLGRAKAVSLDENATEHDIEQAEANR